MKIFAPIFILALILTDGSAQNIQKNQTAPWFVERFRITAGTFVPISNTNVQVGIKGGIAGTDIDFENDLDFNKSQLTFLANFQWRITRRSRINLNYYNIPRSSNHTLQRDIVFNGNTYPVNASVNSFFNTAIYQVSYGYAIVAKPDYELGAFIGTHLVGGKTGIALNVNGGGVSGSTDFGFTAPLPDLGIWGGYAFSKRLAVNLDMNYLSLTIDNFSGRIFAYNLLFRYRLIEKLDLSLGFSGLNCKVDVNKTNIDAHFKWGYNGPAIAATYSFGKKPW